MKRKALAIGIALATALALSCDKKKKNDKNAIPSSGVDGVSNQLALAYPGGLALSVFPTEDGTSLVDSEPKSLRKKNEEAKKILNGEGESCLAPAAKRFLSEGAETCYEFDQEMIYGKKGESATVKGTKNGKNGSGEACLVAFARGKVQEIQGIIERRLGMMQSMLCQAKKDNGGITLPAEGGELDLKAALEKSMEQMPDATKPTIVAAKIKRLTNDDGRPVYRYDITFKKGDKTREFHVAHSPKSETDNNEYRGILWSKSQIAGTDMERHLSIRYALTNDNNNPQLVGELLRARINKNISANAFDKGLLDLNVNADFSGAANTDAYGKYKDENGVVYGNQNDAVSGITFVSFQLNLADNSGTTSYWQNPGANYRENARGMVFSLASGTEMKGCGTAGAAGTPSNAMSIRQKMKLGNDTKLKAAGSYHPFFNDKSDGGCSGMSDSDDGDFTKMNTCDSEKRYWHKPATTASLVNDWAFKQTSTTFTKQCVKLVNGKYEIDTAVTTDSAGYSLTSTASDAVISPDIEGVLSTIKVD